jgi:hypothetical protein
LLNLYRNKRTSPTSILNFLKFGAKSNQGPYIAVIVVNSVHAEMRRHQRTNASFSGRKQDDLKSLIILLALKPFLQEKK